MIKAPDRVCQIEKLACPEFFSGDKHSSLFCSSVSDEEQKFYKNDTRSVAESWEALESEYWGWEDVA